MKVTMVGGTGFIGRHIAPILAAKGHEVSLASRNPQKVDADLAKNFRIQEWDPLNYGSLENTCAGQDAIINLAGASIAKGRWTPARKDILRSSRINTTWALVNALSNIPATHLPKVLISASGIGYYGIDTLEEVDELSNPGNGFLSDLCAEWEQEARRASDLGIRTICLRISMVLGKDGGTLQKMLLPFRLFVGGPIGHGNQPVSWIHVEDLGRLVGSILENNSIHGPINAASPNPISMKEFCQILGQTMGRPSWLPIPEVALKIGLGEMSTLMTHGQRVVPLLVRKLGFSYKYPDLNSALSAILKDEAGFQVS